MSLSYRLFGNRELAATYRGEALRLLSFLRERLALGGIDSLRMSRTYPDGTVINLSSFFGSEIAAIQSPFFGGKRPPETWDRLYLMVYWDAENKKFYEAKRTFENGSVTEIRVRELDISFEVDILNAYLRTAPIILNDFQGHPAGPDHQVVNYGPTRDDWIAVVGVLANNDYRARFYLRRLVNGVMGGNVGYTYRQVLNFRDNYSTTSAYLPMKTGDDVAWEELLHSAYGTWNEFRGPANFTLEKDDRGRDYASSWGERIAVSGYGPQNYTTGGQTYTGDLEPIFGVYAYQDIGMYSWPVIGSANLRKRPLLYSIKYETDAGTQELPEVLQDQLDYSYVQEYTDTDSIQLTTCQETSHWPVACLGGKRPFYFKNVLDYHAEGTAHQDPGAPGESAGTWTRSSSTSDAETLRQELRVGNQILCVENSSFNVTTDFILQSTTILVPRPPPFPPYLQQVSWGTAASRQMTAHYAFRDVLAFSDFQGYLICVAKKTTVDLEMALQENSSGPSINYVLTTSVHQEAHKTVEYEILTNSGGSRRLASFQQTMVYDQETATRVPAQGPHELLYNTWNGTQNGTGQRAHGISCQANPGGIFVFSYTLEDFVGTGDLAGQYIFFAPLEYSFAQGPWNHWKDLTPTEYYAGPVQATSKPLYPFPLEDQNTLLDASPAWTNQRLGVGVISQGVSGRGYFDFVSPPGSVGIVKRTREE